jgi:hypothetical protein
MRREALPLCEALHLAVPSPQSRLLALRRPPGGPARASLHTWLDVMLDDATL